MKKINVPKLEDIVMRNKCIYGPCDNCPIYGPSYSDGIHNDCPSYDCDYSEYEYERN